ncbi:MAG: ribosome small subunit-dependent GTPase A [Elusimicrobiota bacterium]
MNLHELGWNEFHEKNYNEIKTQTTFPARVVKADREKYLVYSAFGELTAELRGILRFKPESMNTYPVVGDWVAAEMMDEGNTAIIAGVLPRMSKFSRKVAGDVTDEQVLVANIDTVFLVNGLDGDYNLRRIERYLSVTQENKLTPVIVLNKTDMCPDVQEKIKEVETVALGIPIVTMSALNSDGIDNIRKYIVAGTTTAFLGSSGVGKSTIINRLLGEEKQKVGAVRARDCRGMHITTQREMILLPGGGIVIDNPGLRELQLWINEGTLTKTFNDIQELAVGCKFSDCTHTNEPGCAVTSAIENGKLDDKRLQSYIKLKKELKYLATRKLTKARNVKIVTEKKISKLVKQIYKHRRKNRYTVDN